MQATLNYKEIMTGQPAIPRKADYTLAQHIMQTEREAVLCQSLHRAASSPAAGQTFRRSLVVGVVGEAHLEGIAELWQNKRWQDMLQEVHTGARLRLYPCVTGFSSLKVFLYSPKVLLSLASVACPCCACALGLLNPFQQSRFIPSPCDKLLPFLDVNLQDAASRFLRIDLNLPGILTWACAAGDAPITDSSASDPDSETAGVRRALAESMLRLSCRDSVLSDIYQSLGPVPKGQAHAHNLTTELYGTTRMLLACLSQADLAKVPSFPILCTSMMAVIL